MRNLIAGVDLDHMGPGLSTTGKAEADLDDELNKAMPHNAIQ